MAYGLTMVPRGKRKRGGYRTAYNRGRYRRPYYRKRTFSIPRYRISGRGDYKTWWGNFRNRWLKPYTGKLAGVGAAAGGALGNVIAPGIGGTVGGGIGGLAGMAVDRIMGWGDYVINKNTIAIPSQAGGVPTFGRGSIRVTHKEYIGSVRSSGNFALSAYNLNPGVAESFPWLSSIAQNFEQYRWNGLVFQFVSTSANALDSVNTALGKVIMATDYNSADPNFSSFHQMAGTEFSNMGKPSENIMHAVECDPKETPIKSFWVRTGPPPSDTDIRLYDLGKFQLATTGSQASADIGDLWCTYDVTFWKPVMNTVSGDTIPISHWDLTSITNTNMFGNNFEPEGGSNLDFVIDEDTIFFPPNVSSQRYLIWYRATGTSAALTAPTPARTNVVASPFFGSGTFAALSNNGATGPAFFSIWCEKVTGPNASITFSSGAFPTSSTGGDLIIMQIPDDII